ncbi:MAG: hypothetical protein DRP16_03500 [Candidatus Aenigmatarchaeota archaeon]|nr:MAG: hypothetical protein DRP16_03500 [Candidatus Aenigmarchaeota archaeon]
MRYDKFLFVSFIFVGLFCLVISVWAEIICSYPGPDVSEDLMRLTNFTVTGPSVLREGDIINVSFYMQNYGQYDLNLGSKGIFVAAKNPDGQSESFGITRANTILKPGESVSIQATKILDKSGNWLFWPSYHLSLATGEKFGPENWHGCSLVVLSGETDSDKDGIIDQEDNCPQTYNPEQKDIDGDGKGDACDSCDDRDTDNDGIKNCLDVCIKEPETYNGYEDEDGCPDSIQDETPPSVSIFILPSSPTPDDKVSFIAQASDVSGIKNISVFVDDDLKITCQAKCKSSEILFGKCYEYTITEKNQTVCIFKGGPYTPRNLTYRAEAFDNVGNKGQSVQKYVVIAFETSRPSPQIGTCLRAVGGTIRDFPYDLNTLKIKTCRLAPREGSTFDICEPTTISYTNVSLTDSTLTYTLTLSCTGRYLIQPVPDFGPGKCEWHGSWRPENYIINVEDEELSEDLYFVFQPSTLYSINEYTYVPCDLCNITNLPEYFDWRKWNMVSPIKDQGRCGSCWAFATVGAIESTYNVEQLRPVNLDLSEQNLVSDCYPEASCSGRTASDSARLHTFNYIKTNGIVDENCFPYQSSNCSVYCCDPEVMSKPDYSVRCPQGCVCSCDDGSYSIPCSCSRCSDWNNRLWRISDYDKVGRFVTDKKRALLCHGPLHSCGGGHCVVIVGWNDYTHSWIIKNSWGLDWRDMGFGEVPYDDSWTWNVFYVDGVIHG